MVPVPSGAEGLSGPLGNLSATELKKAQGEVVLDQGAINLHGPVPAKLIRGFQDRKAGQSNAVCRSAILA
jgi:hypothetical protein